MADLLPHGCGASAKIVIKELPDEALGDENVPQGWVGGQGPEQCDAMFGDS